MEQGLYAGCVQFAQFFDEMDHPLEVFFDPFFFCRVEFQAGQVGQVIYQRVIDFHANALETKIADFAIFALQKIAEGDFVRRRANAKPVDEGPNSVGGRSFTEISALPAMR
jgi:hypothetical protein